MSETVYAASIASLLHHYPVKLTSLSLSDNTQNQQSKAQKDKCNQMVLTEANANLIRSQFEKVCAKINSYASKHIDEISDDILSHPMFKERRQ